MKIKNLLLATIGLYIGVSAQANNLQFNHQDLQKFEDTNICQNCDLSGSMPKSNHSRANLMGTNLSFLAGNNINLAEATLQNANLSSGSFILANFSEANLTNANLSNRVFWPIPSKV